MDILDADVAAHSVADYTLSARLTMASDNTQAAAPPMQPTSQPEVDDFGLPLRSFQKKQEEEVHNEPNMQDKDAKQDVANDDTKVTEAPPETDKVDAAPVEDQKPAVEDSASDSDEADFKDAQSEINPESALNSPSKRSTISGDATPTNSKADKDDHKTDEKEIEKTPTTPIPTEDTTNNTQNIETPKAAEDDTTQKLSTDAAGPKLNGDAAPVEAPAEDATKPKISHNRDTSITSVNGAGVSEFSHQALQMPAEEKEEEDDGWQQMPAFAPYDMYDDDDKLIAREMNEDDMAQDYGYGGLGGAGKGYTRVLMDEDAQSATSMDDNTQYLFKDTNGTSMDDEDTRDAVSQMQATKDLLTEGQRIAYVGIVRLEIAKLIKEAESIEVTKKTKKELAMSTEATQMWGQKMMLRVYSHMDISEAEQVMIEQLAEHGVQPADLTPALMVNARVQNPMAEKSRHSTGTLGSDGSSLNLEEDPAEPPPPYESHEAHDVPDVKDPSQLPTTAKIDIDLRWTVLCDLFLLLIADSIYDARSRVLLERVGASLEIAWIDICRFEKRVTDALEMQQAAEKENWNEDEHMEARRKQALKRRYVMMGLATVGGGLVIGLSAGLLAPVIGAGLAAGFTTIGVGGTSSFLAGAGGAAIITSSAAASGSLIGGRAANRRTGSVKTFEYRPLHNNKRVNLVVTVSGWLTGKMDDVRLPFSTVDPIMGDMYSVLWEPEMLRSMGDTINILATEALTQGLQQVLGNTILVSLMAALQLPLVLTKLSYLIDNPWAVSLDRATAAGLILADSLIERSLGTRPITLVGYSLGSRVIHSCLMELAKKGAYGVVQNVYLFGSPIVTKKEEYIRARTVVSGRFVNGYNRNDWILGYLFRLTNGGIRKVAGLAPIDDCPWIENVDVTDLVAGHMEYRTAMPKLLKTVGWTVTSEEFSEIEDPDPENHGERQRELINEIEEARKELEKTEKTKKSGRFSLFGRGKKGDKEEWEVYEETGPEAAAKAGEKSASSGVLFDVDAMRAELAKEAQDLDEEGLEHLQIREIESTLPPMKLDIPSESPTSSAASPVNKHLGAVRETQSTDALPSRSLRPAAESGLSYHSDSGHMEDEISMTFDTSFNDDSKTLEESHDGEKARSTQTLPNMKLADPWGDPDDDDFGEEKEISMTFA